MRWIEHDIEPDPDPRLWFCPWEAGLLVIIIAFFAWRILNGNETTAPPPAPRTLDVRRIQPAMVGGAHLLPPKGGSYWTLQGDSNGPDRGDQRGDEGVP